MINAPLLFLACSITACISMSIFRHVLSGNIAWRGDILMLIRDLLALLLQPMFLLGILAFTVATTLWLVVLATQKLSVAYPVQIGLVTIFSGAISVIVFREVLPPRALFGYLMLLGGVVLIYR
jgi:multidrug transporter EmrE-like cation transporter